MTRRKLSGIWKRKISIKSKEAAEVAHIKDWTKHVPTWDDALDGRPAEPNEVFDILEDKKWLVDEIYEDVIRKLIVLKTKKGSWYQTDVSNLAQLRDERKAEHASQMSIYTKGSE